MAKLGEANIGGRMVPAWLLDLTAEELDGLKWHTNKNLLDNWYFVGGGSQQGGGQFPINQRGQTSYGTNIPAFDRWLTTTNCSSLTISQDGVTCNAIIAGQYPFQSYIDADYSDFAGKTVTISALIDDDLISATGVIPAQKPTVSNVRMVMSSSGGSYDVGFGYITNKNYFQFGFFARAATASDKFKAAKLELGSKQTLAYQDEEGNWQLFETPDYGEELAKCQAYLKPLAGFYTGGTSASSVTKVSFFVPGPMRALPVVSGVTNLGDAYIAGAEIPDGIVYFGNGSFNVIQRGNGYIVQVEQPKSIGSLKNGIVAFDVGWLNAEL